jgi:hypothetical protein
LTLDHGWVDRGAGKAAAVNGIIPVMRVLERFSGPGAHVAAVNCLDVRPDGIRLIGPVFEDYLISASSAALR